MTLKPGWRRVKFGDVVRLSKARSQDPLTDGFDRYVGLEHLEPGDLRIRSWGNVADGVTFTSVFQPGQVLFGKRRAYQRKVAVADFAGVCSGDIYVLETNDAQILLPELLPFICQTDAFFDHAVGTSAGSLSPRTNWTSLADFVFALPPMEEQTTIVDILLAARAVPDAQSDALTRLQSLRQSTIDQLLLLPENEVCVRLEKVATMQNGRPFPGDEYADEGIKLLRPGNRPNTRVSRTHVLPLQQAIAGLVSTHVRTVITDSFRTDDLDFWGTIVPLEYRAFKLLSNVKQRVSEGLATAFAEISLISPAAWVILFIAIEAFFFHRYLT